MEFSYDSLPRSNEDSYRLNVVLVNVKKGYVSEVFYSTVSHMGKKRRINKNADIILTKTTPPAAQEIMCQERSHSCGQTFQSRLSNIDCNFQL